MRNRWLALVLGLLLIGTLAGCAPRPAQGELAQSAAGDQVVVDTPAFVLEYDEQGNLATEGPSLGAVMALSGADLPAALQRTPEEIEQLQSAGVEMFYADLAPDGLSLFVNGQPLPSMAWDADSLAALGQLVGAVAGENGETIAGLLPLLSNVSTGIVMRFPGAEADAPLVGTVDQAAIDAATKNALNATLAELGIPAFAVPLLQALPPLSLNFDASGSATLGGLPPMLAGFIPPDALAGIKLPPDQMASLSEAGITSIGLKTSPQTLDLSVNGTPLPPISWGSGEFANLQTLAIDSGLLEMLGVSESATAPLNQLNRFLPLLQSAKVDLTVNLPQ